MSKKDVVAKKFLSDNRRFADLCNYYFFDGKQLMQPEDLRPLDTTELVSIINPTAAFNGLNTNSNLQKLRDILKSTIVKHTRDRIYIIIGIENQSDIHYAMPVRTMLYDALNYNSEYNRLDGETVTAINTFTNINLNYTEKEDFTDMCKAWDDHKLSEIREGIIEGKAEKLIEYAIKLLNKGFSAEQTSDILEEPLETVRSIYDIAASMAPDYDVKKSYEKLADKALFA